MRQVKIALDETRSFVRQRLQVLDTEMKNFPEGFIFINILGTIIDYPLGIGSLGYSEEISQKVRSSITEEIWNTIAKVITSKIFGGD